MFIALNKLNYRKLQIHCRGVGKKYLLNHKVLIHTTGDTHKIKVFSDATNI